MELTQQQHNFNTNQSTDQTLGNVHAALNNFLWHEEWTLYHQKNQEGEEACPPGIIVGYPDSDKTLHIFMENEGQYDLFFDYTEPLYLWLGFYKTTKRVHNFRANIPLDELKELLTLFADKNFEALKPRTRE